MKPILLLVPLAVGAGLIFAFKGSSSSNPAYTPPPGTPAVASGGSRYQSYMNQLNGASIAYQAGSLFDKSDTSAAATQLKGTLDVVAGMAANDAKAGNITAMDLSNINAQVAAMKKQWSA